MNNRTFNVAVGDTVSLTRTLLKPIAGSAVLKMEYRPTCAGTFHLLVDDEVEFVVTGKIQQIEPVLIETQTMYDRRMEALRLKQAEPKDEPSFWSPSFIEFLHKIKFLKHPHEGRDKYSLD